MGLFSFLEDPDTARQQKWARDAHYNEADEYGTFKGRANAGYDALKAGGYDKDTSNRYYDEVSPDLERGFSQSSQGTADSYARRGLGRSGMATGAQGNVALNAAIQRRQARMGAIDRATAVKRQTNLDAMGAAKEQYAPALGRWQALQGQANQAEANFNNELGGMISTGTQVGMAAMGVPPVGAMGGAPAGAGNAGMQSFTPQGSPFASPWPGAQPMLTPEQQLLQSNGLPYYLMNG